MKKILLAFLLLSFISSFFFENKVYGCSSVRTCKKGLCSWDCVDLDPKTGKPIRENDDRGGGGGAAVTTTTTGTTTTAVTATTTVNETVATTGTEDLCKSIEVSTKVVNPGQEFTITSTAKSDNVVSFGFNFYNLDNLDASGKAKPIKFVSTANYNFVNNFTVATDYITQKFSFADFDKKDLNWNFYMPKPKNVRVDAFFKKVGSTTWSKEDNKCQATFKVVSIDPTPTPNAACACAAAGTCATACFFDKLTVPGNSIIYANPIKCNLGNDLFRSAPTATDKTNWCRYYVKTKGDANGDGKVNFMDYLYYVAAKHGAKLPPSINVDFNGDGFISADDRKILITSMKK